MGLTNSRPASLEVTNGAGHERDAEIAVREVGVYYQGPCKAPLRRIELPTVVLDWRVTEVDW
jgi:hypothetical protein